MTKSESAGLFYGWWIVVAAFLNLFFAVGIIFYGFPVFYPALVDALGFTRAQVTQGFLLGFLIVGLPCGYVAGVVIDRLGARWVTVAGTLCIGASLLLMGRMTKLWEYEALCILEVTGYVLAGPIANQVLVARWFTKRRGRAMGLAYLGLGLGGVAAPKLVNYLIHTWGWRSSLQIVGVLIMVVLIPVGILITRSTPEEKGLLPDGEKIPAASGQAAVAAAGAPSAVSAALATSNFWLILLGSTLAIGAIGGLIQNFILFLKDQGYSAAVASTFMSELLAASLCGRVIVGYIADRFLKKNTMAVFYFVVGASLTLLSVTHQPAAVWMFAILFGFAMGADYMLVPLVTAESFGTASLGKLLALIISGYSLGQWGAPWIAGKIFDARHSYQLAWQILAVAGILGAAAIYAVRVKTDRAQA